MRSCLSWTPFMYWFHVVLADNLCIEVICLNSFLLGWDGIRTFYSLTAIHVSCSFLHFDKSLSNQQTVSPFESVKNKKLCIERLEHNCTRHTCNFCPVNLLEMKWTLCARHTSRPWDQSDYSTQNIFMCCSSSCRPWDQSNHSQITRKTRIFWLVSGLLADHYSCQITRKTSIFCSCQAY